MSSWNDTEGVEGLENLVGHKVIAVEMDEASLIFYTDENKSLHFSVEGECCSYSYFHDMVGKDKLIANGLVIEVGDIALEDDGLANDTINPNDRYDNYVQVYGYKIITESEKWGEQTTVFSFRNSSNGYYGGWMNFDGIREVTDAPVLG